MDIIKYDNFKITLKQRDDGGLIVFVDYYKNGKFVEQKRTTNTQFIEKILITATSTIKNVNYVGLNLEASYQDNGSIVIEDYDQLKNRSEFVNLDKKVSKKMKKKSLETRVKKNTSSSIQKKELLKGVKNIKVSKNDNLFKKVRLNKFIPIATLGLIVMTQVMPVVRNMEYFKPVTKTNMEVYDDLSEVATNVVSNQNIYADVKMDVQQLIRTSFNQKNESESSDNGVSIGSETIVDELENINDQISGDVSSPQVVDVPVEDIVIQDIVDTIETAELENDNVNISDANNNNNNNFESVANNIEVIDSSEEVIIENVLPTVDLENVIVDTEVINEENVADIETVTQSNVDDEMEGSPDIILYSTDQLDSDSNGEIDEVIEEENIDVVEDDSIIDTTNDSFQGIIEDENLNSDIVIDDSIEIEENTIEDIVTNDLYTPDQLDFVVSETLSKHNLTDEQFDKICAVVQQEAGSNPDEVKNVITTVVNRMDSGEWGGTTPWEVITAPGQFESYNAGHYKKYQDHKYDESTAYIVASTLNGNMETTHDWERFRSNDSTDYGGTILTPGGNRYK